LTPSPLDDTVVSFDRDRALREPTPRSTREDMTGFTILADSGVYSLGDRSSSSPFNAGHAWTVILPSCDECAIPGKRSPSRA